MNAPQQLPVVGWLAQFAQEDGTVDKQYFAEDPDGLRFNDSGEPSPFRADRIVLEADATSRIRELEGALEKERADAERYRVIRDAGSALKLYTYDDPNDSCSGDWVYKPSAAFVDEWCDAARKALEGEKL